MMTAQIVRLRRPIEVALAGIALALAAVVLPGGGAARAYVAGPNPLPVHLGHFIWAQGGPGEMLVSGAGFTPGAVVRVEALTSDLTVLRTVFAYTDGSGDLDDVLVDSLPASIGSDWVAADQLAPAPSLGTAWTSTSVGPPAYIVVPSGVTYPCHTVWVEGANFQPGATLLVVLYDSGMSQLDVQHPTVGSTGSFWLQLHAPASTPAGFQSGWVYVDEPAPAVLSRMSAVSYC